MPIVNYNNGLCFKGKPLSSINLVKYSGQEKVGTEKALISLLDDKAPSDIDLVKKIMDFWSQNTVGLNDSDSYLSNLETTRFCKNFLGYDNIKKQSCAQDMMYLSMERHDEENPLKKVLGLMKIKKSAPKHSGVSISYISVNPQQISANPKKDVGGVGQLLFAKAAQICNQGGFKELSLVSDNDEFYYNFLKKASLSNPYEFQSGISFIFPVRKLIQIQRYFDEKYGMSFLSTPVEKEIASFKLEG